MKTVVISDVHGNFEALEECLFNAGVINAKGNRMNDADNRCRVISLGDLANCVKEDESGDVACLRKVGEWIDVMLMGNHEHPYMSHNPLDRRIPIFGGFYYSEYVHDELKRINDMGLLRPAELHGNLLLTHAGWDKDSHPFISTAQQASQALREALQNEGWSHRYFSAIGQMRGGYAKHGGILWEDFREIRSPFPQLFGHTVGRTIRYKENAICIDTGGGKYGKPTAITL